MSALEGSSLGEDVASGLRKVLNIHGYGFHYSILGRAMELAKSQRSNWDFEVAEFPVRVQTFDTRIDFLLKHRFLPRLLVAECKRANPATANWCFVRAPFVARSRSARSVTAETMTYYPEVGLYSSGKNLTWSDHVYHLAFELRANEKGDPGGSSRTQIEEAAAQVLKGVNGLVEYFAGHIGQVTDTEDTPITPVIFTTAQLWVSDTDLRSADVLTGKVSPDQIEVKHVPWLWFQYHQSPSLRHARPSVKHGRTVSDALESEFARSIAVVSADGIDSFLAADW